MAKKKVARRDGIYERPDTKGFWGSWTDAQGRRRRRRFDAPTLEQARAMLAAERHRVEEQVKFGRPTPCSESFAAFATAFLTYRHRRISSRVTRGKLTEAEYDRQRSIIKTHLLPHFGQMQLALVRRKDVAVYINARMGEAGDGTIIKEVNVLKRMFNVAIELEKVQANPAQKAPLPKAPEGRVRYLSPEELGRVFRSCTLYDRTGGQLLTLADESQWLRNFAGLSVALGTAGESFYVPGGKT